MKVSDRNRTAGLICLAILIVSALGGNTDDFFGGAFDGSFWQSSTAFPLSGSRTAASDSSFWNGQTRSNNYASNWDSGFGAGYNKNNNNNNFNFNNDNMFSNDQYDGGQSGIRRDTWLTPPSQKSLVSS